MLTLARSVAFVSLLLAGSCSTVHSRQALGTKPHVLDVEDWNGTWLNGCGGTTTIRVLDGRQGILEIDVMSPDKDSVRLVMECQLLEQDGWVLASYRDPEQPDLFLWARVWRDDEQIIVWLPNAENLSLWIGNGRLPGELNEGGNSILGPLQGEHLRFITKYGERSLAWETPLAMIRIAK
jgi:hypothetical protein